MQRPPTTPPATVSELLARAQAIAGRSLGELAQWANISIPANLQRHKGWPGQLVELWLGATAGSKPQQDFPHLGVELKTLPLSKDARPLETTYVCYAPLIMRPGTTWQSSNVCNKLSQVLWLPLEGERDIPLAERRIASAFLWQPSPPQATRLQADWTLLTDFIVTGNVEQVTARQGEILQLRPKAANGKVLTDAFGPDGERIKTRPRGFYLRKSFTNELLQDAFGG